VPKYGIVGAAWATSVAYCFNAVVKGYLVRRLPDAGFGSVS